MAPRVQSAAECVTVWRLVHGRKHTDEYNATYGSVFTNTHTFEILGMVLAKDYDALAER